MERRMSKVPDRVKILNEKTANINSIVANNANIGYIEDRSSGGEMNAIRNCNDYADRSGRSSRAGNRRAAGSSGLSRREQSSSYSDKQQSGEGTYSSVACGSPLAGCASGDGQGQWRDDYSGPER